MQSVPDRDSLASLDTAVAPEVVAPVNHFELIDSAEDYWNRLKNDIDNAEKTIDIATFLMSNDKEVGGDILTHLEAATLRGVDVRVMTDIMPWPLRHIFIKSQGLYRRTRDFERKVNKKQRRVGSNSEGKRMGRFTFKKSNESKVWRSSLGGGLKWIMQRDHTKLTVIDSGIKDRAVAYVGGRNIWYKDKDNRDFMIRMSGNIAMEAQQSFNDNWAGLSHGGVYPQGSEVGKDTCIVRESRGSNEIFEGLLNAIEGAKDRVWIETPYFDRFNLMPVFFALGKRNKQLIDGGEKLLDVRLVTTTPVSNNHKNYVWSAPLFLNEIAHAGKDCGIQVYGYAKENGRFENKFILNHSKAALVDDLGIVGSSNFNRLKIWGGGNAEVNLFSREPELVTQLENWFEDEFRGSEVILPKTPKLRERIYRVGRLAWDLSYKYLKMSE